MAKITKDMVPQEYTLSLAAVDAVPVLFFGINAILIGYMLNSILFMVGAVLCFLGGAIKVAWKFTVVLKKKNIWWMFIQMRILMPIGFLLMILSPFFKGGKATLSAIWYGFTTMPSLIFFLVGVTGMILMGVFAKTLDGSQAKSNWLEQLTNGISQIFIFAGLLILLIL